MFRLKSRIPFNSKRKRDPLVKTGEEGYILLAVLFLVVMVLITLSIAAPKVAADIERDREMELQHRGLQYRRAIQLYYKKFNAYPPNMDALVKTNEIRFLRKRYVDPATGKDEWHLIHFGENKTPTAIGFFGQAIAGTTLGGTGPGGVGQGLGNPIGQSAFGGKDQAGGGAFGGSSLGGSSFGGNSPGGSSFGGSSIGGSSFGSNAGTPSTDPNAGAAGVANGATGATGTPVAGGTPGAAGTDANSAVNTALGSNTPSTFDGSGQTFGGGGIIGVESTSPKATILEYKKKKHFNEWEFVYDPLAERQQAAGGAGIGKPIGGPGNGTGDSPFGNSPSLSNQPPGSIGSPPNGGQPQSPVTPQQ